MKIGCICFTAVLFGVVSVLAQQAPIIDRETFFFDPEISYAQLSPDGKFMTFLKQYKNVKNLWIKERTEPFEKARPLTIDTTRPISPFYNWSRDSRYVIYRRDKGGDENFHIYVVEPASAGDSVPPIRDLTPFENVQARIIDVPRKTPDQIIIGLNDRDPKVHDVYQITLSTGVKTLVRKNTGNIMKWQTDLDGKLRLGTRQLDDGGLELLKIQGDSMIAIFSVNAEESLWPIRFTPDGNSFYLTTNKGDIDKSQLMLFNLKSNTLKLIAKDPEDETDFAEAVFSDSTGELIGTVYIGDKRRVYFPQSALKSDLEKMKKQLPDGNIYFGNRTADEQLWIAYVDNDVDMGSFYLFDRKSKKVEFMRSSQPGFPSKDLSPMQAIRYRARDGMSIPAYLVLPKGIEPKKLPTIVFPHGGPWERYVWRYTADAQLLANRGYAVLMPNFRGSWGYGKKFLNAGNKQWGTGFMQHDITDGVQYLIKQGIADPKKIGIYGGSYGGFAVLAGLAFTPDLYAAGFDYVGISNIITFLNSIPPYWIPLKKLWAKRVGDMDNPEERKMLMQQSPLNSVRNIKAPLFVAQGANDPRVKKSESDQIVVALRDQGKSVEYICAPDKGHGFIGKQNWIALHVAMEKFFARHLGGRMQEEVPEAIQKRLNAITVNVKDLVIKENLEEKTDNSTRSSDTTDTSK